MTENHLCIFPNVTAWRCWNETLISWRSRRTVISDECSSRDDATVEENSSVINDRSSLFNEQEHRVNVRSFSSVKEKRWMHENHRYVNRAAQHELMHYWSGELWSFVNWINNTISNALIPYITLHWTFSSLSLSLSLRCRALLCIDVNSFFRESNQSDNPFRVLQNTLSPTFTNEYCSNTGEGHRNRTLTRWYLSMHYSFHLVMRLCQFHRLPCLLVPLWEWCVDRATTAAIVHGFEREYPSFYSRWLTVERSIARRERDRSISTMIWTESDRTAHKQARWPRETREYIDKQQNMSRCSSLVSAYCWSSWSSDGSETCNQMWYMITY